MAQKSRTASSRKNSKSSSQKQKSDGTQHRRSPQTRSSNVYTKKKLIDENTKRDIIGVLFFILAIVFMLVVTIPSDGALFSNMASEWIHLAIGVGSYILPFVLAAIGFTFIYRKQRERISIRATLGLSIVFIALLGFISLFSPINVLGEESPFLLFSQNTLRSYGGYVGASIAWVGITFFGHLISGVILLGLIVVGILIVGFSVSNMIELVRKKKREHDIKVANNRERASLGAKPPARIRKTQDPIPYVSKISPDMAYKTFDEESSESRTRPLVNNVQSNSSFSSHRSRRDPDKPNPFGSINPVSAFDPAKTVPLMGLSKEEKEQEEKDFALLMEEFGGQTDDDFNEEKFFEDISNGIDPATGYPFEDAFDQYADSRDEYHLDPSSLNDRYTNGFVKPADKTIPLNDVLDAKLVDAEPKNEPKVLNRPVADIALPQPQSSGSVNRISLDDIPQLEDKVSAITVGDSTPIELIEDDFSNTSIYDGQNFSKTTFNQTFDDDIDLFESSDLRDFTYDDSAKDDALLNGSNKSATSPSKRSRSSETPSKTVSKSRSKSGFTLPSFSLLKRGDRKSKGKFSGNDLEQTAERLATTLSDFGIDASVVGWIEGPTVTLFKVDLPSGVRVSRITALNDDIALALAAPGVRIFAPIPGTNHVGIEVPNAERQTVLLSDVLKDAPDGPLQIAIGKDVEGNSIVSDLAKMPHLLIGGTTGSGKSVSINAMIMSILMRATPDEVRFIMIDPKRVEFTPYNGIPHLYVPVVTEPREAASALSWGVAEMERRLKIFSKVGARNISQYNSKVRNGLLDNEDNDHDHAELPYIVIIIDELADLMMNVGKEVEFSISRIAQLARAAGIHLIVATQRPSTNVVTGLIKANITNRIAFNVASGIDSRVILDTPGAENLIGLGDLLLSKPELAKPQRIQGCYVSEDEINAVVDEVKSQSAPDYHSEILQTNVMSLGDTDPHGGSGGDDDPLLWEAADLVVSSKIGSTSNIQRRLKVGYSRAGRIMDQLEEKGIVGAPNGSKPREVLVDEMELETLKAFELNDA